MRTIALLLLFVLLLLFWRSFQFEQTVFSNDGPFGSLVAQQTNPESFTGGWADLWWVGDAFPTPGPSPSVGIKALCGAVVDAAIFLLWCGAIAVWWGRGQCNWKKANKAVGVACFTEAAIVATCMIHGGDWIWSFPVRASGLALMVAIILAYTLNDKL